MKKRLFLSFAIFLTIALPLSTQAMSGDDDFQRIAQQYADEIAYNHPVWKGNNPTIQSDPVPFYTHDATEPSYLEYDVDCSDTLDCGYIFVNIDNTDAQIPMASAVGKPMSEQMNVQKGGDTKNYYFGIFEQFAYNEDKGVVGYSNPENAALSDANNSPRRLKTDSKDETLNQKFQNLKNEAIEQKEEKLEYRANQARESKKSNDISKRSSGNSSAVVRGEKFTGGGCNSVTPCYKYHQREYPDGTVAQSGCVPTALSILIGYYDKNGKSNLLPGNAPSVNNSTIENLEVQLGNMMDINNVGGVNRDNYYLGYNYFNDKGYNIVYTKRDTNMLSYIKSEINRSRPVIASVNTPTGGHAITIYGHSGNRLLVNYGWGVNSANVIIDFDGNRFSGYRDGYLKVVHLGKFSYY